MSDLRQAVADYLAIRHALGFQLRGYDRLLGDLVDNLARAGASTLTTELAVAWATKPACAQPFRWKTRLSVARGFARYLQSIDPAAQVPPSNLLAYRRARPAPYLYGAAEIDALLEATDTLRPSLRAVTYRTLLGLLAVTGMRVGEAIALDRDDVDPRARTLAIRAAKHASRQLPLHASTADALYAYARRRDQLCPAPTATPSFFVSTAGTRLIYECVRETFIKLRGVAGLDRGSGPSPRIHDLRHGFAVQTLLHWHHAGVDVAARLPLLSAWLGHRHPASTYYYLQAAPELLALAAERLPELGARS
jgi:integrase/recombinase XerD